MKALGSAMRSALASRSRRRKLAFVCTAMAAAVLADVSCNFAHEPRLTLLGLVLLSSALAAWALHSRRLERAPSPSPVRIENRP